MMERLILFSNIAAASVRCIVGLSLISQLLSSPKPKKRGAAAAAGGAAVMAVIFSNIGLSDLYRMGSETFLLVVCSRYFQKTCIRMSLFIGVFYEITVSFWQFLAAAWLGVLFGSPLFLDFNTGYGQTAVCLLHLLLLTLGWYLLKASKITAKEAFRLASVIAVAGFLASVTLAEQTVLTIADDTLNMWTTMAIVIMMSVLVFNVNRQYEGEKELARLKSEQAELLERDYVTLNKAYAINAKLFHDFHNHIGVLRQLLTHKKMEEALQYLDELQMPVQGLTDTLWTGDDTVDYLINSKAESAKESGIRYLVQVEFPRGTNLQSADLCAILGNLLDNALEAAKKVQSSEERFIQLTIRRINKMLVIKVENSYAAAPIEKDGALKTSKDGHGLHGWGLKSAQTAAEKYDGMVQTSYTEDTFRAVATLSYQSISME